VKQAGKENVFDLSCFPNYCGKHIFRIFYDDLTVFLFSLWSRRLK
jgi:hypothetical protein